MRQIRLGIFSSLLFISLRIFSDVTDYIYPNFSPSFSDYGNSGLINMPSARFMEEGSMGFKWSRQQPYLRGSIIAYPFSWMETLYRYTDINDRLYSPIASFSGGQSLKDKGFDAKFRLLKEGVYLPQIAIGFRDLGGTDRFASEYIVASKFIRNTDFTLGIGWGKLNGGAFNFKNPLSYLSEEFSLRGASGLAGEGGKINTTAFFRGPSASIFGGIEYFFPKMKGLRLKIEYDTTDFATEGERPLPQDSKVNVGLVFPIGKQTKFNLGFTRGNTLQLGFSVAYGYGRKNPLISKEKEDIDIKNSEQLKVINARENRFLYLTTLREMNSRKLYLQSADKKDNIYHVSYSQPDHISYPRATGRVATILDQLSPETIDTFKITSINSDFATYTAEIPRKVFRVNKEVNGFDEVAYYTNITNERNVLDKHEFIPTAKFPIIKSNFTPALRNHIGGPDGFYFGQLWLRLDNSIKFSRSLSITTIASIGISDNFDNLKLPSDSILPHVRTDIVDYLKQGRHFSITRMQMDYIKNPYKDIYTKISAGIFEEMFAGIGGEILYRPFNSNHAIGLEVYDVHQREFNQRFDLKDYNVLTGSINYFYLHNPSNVLFKISGGRYLAKDSGFTFDFSRRFKSGLYVGAFFSLTDISTEEFGEGSFDKGFYFSFPIEIFSTNHQSGRSYFGLKPLTRDGAASLLKGYELWGVTDQNSRNSFLRDFDDLYD